MGRRVGTSNRHDIRVGGELQSPSHLQGFREARGRGARDPPLQAASVPVGPPIFGPLPPANPLWGRHAPSAQAEAFPHHRKVPAGQGMTRRSAGVLRHPSPRPISMPKSASESTRADFFGSISGEGRGISLADQVRANNPPIGGDAVKRSDE